MASQEYSKLLGNISDIQFQQALHKFNLGEFIKAEAISFGLFGQNVFVTSTKGEFVLRGNPHFPWQFLTERFFINQLHEKTPVLVPYPYLLDEATKFFGWSYAIMPRLEGIQLEDEKVNKRLSLQDKREIAQAMGANLAQMQQLQWESSGRYDVKTKTIQPFEFAQESSWPFAPGYTSAPAKIINYEEAIKARIRSLLKQSSGYNALTTDADLEWIEQLISSADDAFDTPFQPCFVMQDYKEGNIVVEKVHSHWQVSGVFDFMGSYFGDGESDLSRPIATYLENDPVLAKDFLNAYLQNKLLRPGFEKRFPIYMLADRLIIWEYYQRTASPYWDKTLPFHKWIRPYIKFIEM